MRVGLAQINPTVGDIKGNASLILSYAQKGKAAGCDVVLFPEMCVTGYPPEDLLLKPQFVTDNRNALIDLSRQIKDIVAIVGFVDETKSSRFNAAAWIEKARVQAVYHKRCLPNYGVFDEQRYFSAGNAVFVRPVKGIRIGVTICEDIWIQENHLAQLKKKKTDVIANISASPFHVGKLSQRIAAFSKTVRAVNAPLLYCNMVGGQDELIFDGGSFGMSARGRVTAQYPFFDEGLHITNITKKGKAVEITSEEEQAGPLPKTEEIFRALLVGLRDYVKKNGFSKVVLGLSGGIDSALVAALAAEALDPRNVVGVTMPSRYNLAETKNDAELVAKNLGIEFHEIPIQPVFQEYLKTLDPLFRRTAQNLAEENLQARVRGNILMALSNKFGWLVLTTGNKSETSTGYCTLYGDMAGGFAVIKDVLKTTVYDLARLINKKAGRAVIPETTISRPPTAELRENQKDEDSLGPYAQLDPIIVSYVEKNQPIAQTSDYARRIVSLIDKSEYKRRQAPPGIKITARAFGRDHRMPITNRYQS